MKRFAAFLVLAISMLVGADLSAQTPGRFRLGVMAGTQITHARVQGPQYVLTNAAPDKLGWMVGMVGQFDVANRLQLEATLGLSRDAVRLDGLVDDSFNGNDLAIESNEDFFWIENSVSLMYKFVSTPSLSAYAGVGISTHALIKARIQYDFEDNGGEGAADENTELMHRWNYALPITAGVEFPLRGDKKLNCSVAYHVGLRGVYAPMTYQSGVAFEDGFYRMNAASLSLAYMFSSFGWRSSGK